MLLRKRPTADQNGRACGNHTSCTLCASHNETKVDGVRCTGPQSSSRLFANSALGIQTEQHLVQPLLKVPCLVHFFFFFPDGPKVTPTLNVVCPAMGGGAEAPWTFLSSLPSTTSSETPVKNRNSQPLRLPS